MNKQTILLMGIALLVGGGIGYAVTKTESPYQNHHMLQSSDNVIPAGMHRMADGSLMSNDTLDTVAANHMNHMMNMIVTSERTFIEGMIPHHQEAVDTAKEVIARGGTTPAIMQLVSDIVTAQETEIADMKRWYEDWYGEAYADTGTYEPMMRELADLSDTAIDRAFLEDMIMHHMGAIMMARSVQPHIEHDEITTLTENIITSQSTEIAAMRSMLQEL